MLCFSICSLIGKMSNKFTNLDFEFNTNCGFIWHFNHQLRLDHKNSLENTFVEERINRCEIYKMGKRSKSVSKIRIILSYSQFLLKYYDIRNVPFAPPSPSTIHLHTIQFNDRCVHAPKLLMLPCGCMYEPYIHKMKIIRKSFYFNVYSTVQSF